MVVRKVDAGTGVISTFAGTALRGSPGRRAAALASCVNRTHCGGSRGKLMICDIETTASGRWILPAA